MYYDLCNGSVTVNPLVLCHEPSSTAEPLEVDTDWPMERVVSMVVPVFFGIIGLAGLVGNALVILGECVLWEKLPSGK